MTDGINLDGFTANRQSGASNSINAGYAPNPASAFPAADMSAQGNAGLGQEGSSGSLPISGADESDM